MRGIIDLDVFERILDGFANFVDDLESVPTKNELLDYHSAFYNLFENAGVLEIEDIENENRVFRILLSQRLSDEEKQKIKFRYKIDVDEGVSGHEWII